MSRRQLENAILDRKAIEEGKKLPDKFSKLEILKEIELESSFGGIFSLQYSHDGDKLAVGFGNGGIRILKAQTGELLKEIRQSRYGGLQVMCMRFHPKQPNILLAGTGEGMLLACNIEDDTVTEVCTEKGNHINCLDFSLDGFNFATGGKDLTVRIYDTKTMQLDKTYEGYNVNKNPADIKNAGPGQRIFALRYHPEYEHIFLTAGWENHLKVWDSRKSDGTTRTIRGPHICGDALDLKEYKILTGSWCATDALQIWNYSDPDGKEKKNIPFPSDNLDGSYLYCAQFCDNDVVVAGGSGTNSAKALNTVTGECLGTIQMTKPVQALDTVHGGQQIAVGGGDNVLKLGALT